MLYLGVTIDGDFASIHLDYLEEGKGKGMNAEEREERKREIEREE